MCLISVIDHEYLSQDNVDIEPTAHYVRHDGKSDLVCDAFWEGHSNLYDMVIYVIDLN